MENVRDLWESLQQHPNSDLDQFRIICKLRQEVVCPHVAVVECDGQPRSLLLGRLEQTFFEPSIGYLKLVRIPAKVLMVLYQGFLGVENDGISEALVRHLWSLLSSGEADAIVFHQLHERSSLLRILLSHGPQWWCEKKPMLSTHWTMNLPEQSGGLLKNLRSKHRSWIRKKQRELESAFPNEISWHWMTTFNDIPDLCKSLEVVAAKTYQRGLDVGFSDNEEYRQRFELFASRGQLRVQLLVIKGKIQAFWIGEVYRGGFHSSATGYDPKLRDYEPGTLLFMRMIDQLGTEGIRHFDFGLGDAFYKSRFGDQNWKEATLNCFAPTAKGMALRFSLCFFGLLGRAGRQMLQMVGGVDRLKAGWRRRLVSSKPETEEK